MKKVRIAAPWASGEEITERLLRQFKTSDEDVNGLEFVYDDSYDLIVFFNYVCQPIKENSKAILFANEPTWSGSHQKNISHYEGLTYFGYDANDYSAPQKVVELPARCFYGGRGPWVDRLDIWSYENLVNFTHHKTKNISSVITPLGKDGSFPPNCLYKDRYALAEYLLTSTPFVTFFGGWHGAENVNTSPLKIDVVADYKFSLVVENEHKRNWITEKFYDCILTNTVPIYFGCKNVETIWPEGGYILLDRITDHEYVKSVLIDVHHNAEELYNQLIPKVKQIKERYFKEYNILKVIQRAANDNSSME